MASRSRYLMIQIIACCVIPLPVIALIAIAYGLDVILFAFFHLFVGWAYFLVRVLPDITLNWTGVLTTVLCLGLLIPGVHYFGNWIFTKVQEKRHVEPMRSWPWRWTISSLAVVVLMFTAGIAMVGIVHQSIWLASSSNSVSVRGGGLPSQEFRNLRNDLPRPSQVAPPGTTLP
jgi:hypothetical protein